MPIYEYSCDDCGGALEQRQRFQDDPLSVCPSCGGSLRRVLHSVGVIFKGGGWYCTDSRPKAKSEPSEGGSSAKPALSEGGTSAKAAPSEGGSSAKPAPVGTAV